jgi:hypothetical protein
MEKIEAHIREILRTEESLIIPRMGCFVLSGTTPDLSVTHQHQGIRFNSDLNHNDGMLADLIAFRERIPYESALDAIETFVQQVRSNLEKTGEYSIDSLGVFQLDREGNIRFSEIKNSVPNFQLSGTPTVLTEAAVEETPVETETDTWVSEETMIHRPTSPLRKAVILAFLCITVSVAYWRFLAISYSLYSSTGYASLNDAASEQLPELRGPGPASTVVPSAPVMKQEERSGTRETRPAATAPVPTNRYFAVAGAFRVKDNARKRLRELRKEGFRGASIISSPDGMYRVAYGSFATKTEAGSKIMELFTEGREVYPYQK